MMDISTLSKKYCTHNTKIPLIKNINDMKKMSLYQPDDDNDRYFASDKNFKKKIILT